jgi:hypothetical protein
VQFLQIIRLNLKSATLIPALIHPQEPLDAVVQIYAEKLKEITGEEPYSIDKIIEFNLQLIPEPDPDSSDPLESVKQQLSQFLGPFEDKVAIIKSQYAAFFVKFEEQAANGRLNKAKCVEISTGCVLEVPSASACEKPIFRPASACPVALWSLFSISHL